MFPWRTQERLVVRRRVRSWHFEVERFKEWVFRR
jgi:hypothetical protein